ncbi:tripartite tricarboxylate transporter substrate binding protein [Pelagibacterium sp. 26DY04]|uniref:Bug family tripartite tricarboxylate transporter substrate binding protein n=1 Tax=Pelagibacterium sp. 26DY04 TaxID=2967130 RepID=UPI00281498B6|nr:tripartite tricarboxylate transporter substrate binding protein [Pelagibacterium sp. 26DY04]WMT88111.1 tripartite tricarboxylate transporter substrate binding protein [Pelagibacterium sp. 26DY04]
MPKLSRFALAGFAMLAGIGSSAVAWAQAYPERDVTLVVQSSAGGGSDIFARTIAAQMSELELVERALLVENRPGGSGTVAYAYTAGQAGNPYVLQTIASSFFTTPLLGQSPVGPDDFTPVAAIAGDPYVLAVNGQSEIQTLEDLKDAGSLTAGTTGVVNDQTILSSLLSEAAGIEIRNVPFDGSGEEMSAVLGGHVDLIFGNPSEIGEQIEAGELRALAVSTAERLESMPDVPTFIEQGYDIEHVQLRAIVMPADVPQEALDYWVERFEALATSDLWREEYVNRHNLEARFVAGEELQALFDQTNATFDALMTEAGLI